MRNWGEHKNNTSSVKGIFLNRFKERYKNLTVQLKSKERIWLIFNLTLISFLKQLYSLFLHTCLCVCVCIFPCLKKVKHLTKGSRGVQEMCCCSRSMRHLVQGLEPLANPEARGEHHPWLTELPAQAVSTSRVAEDACWPTLATERKVLCPATRRTEEGGQDEEFKYSSGEGRGTTSEMGGG